MDLMQWNWWLNSGGGATAPYALYPSTDRAVLAGAGAGAGVRGYLSFGGQAVNNSTGRLYYAYVAQDNHNSTKNGQIMAMYSDDLWVTHSTPVLVTANPGGGVNLRDVDIFITSTGRVLIFYAKAPTGPQQSIGYFKYTDNADLSGLSVETRLTTDYNNQFIDTTGSCVEISGSIYKTTWATTGGGTEIPVYKSTDNGLTWTRISYVGIVAENYDETCIAIHPSGRVYAAIRDNGSAHLIIKYSDDNLLTWSTALDTGVFAVGKHGICITPRGNICVVTRGSGGRTVLIQSPNGTSWSSQNIDGREGLYTYGTPVYHPIQGEPIAMWSVEAQNASTPQVSGPNLIIAKRIQESQTAVAPPTVYDPDYQGWLDFGQANGETLPVDATKTIDNTAIAGARTAGWLTEADHLYLRSHNSTSTKEISKRSVRRPWIKDIETASPTYGTTGWQFDGTTQNLESPYSPSSLAKFALNNAGVFYYTPTDVQGQVGGSYDFGSGDAVFSSVSHEISLEPMTASNNAAFTVNDNTLSTKPVTTSAGSHLLQRTSSTIKKLWQDGVQNGADVSVTSTGRSTRNMIWGGKNFFNGVNRRSVRTIGGITYVGSAASGHESSMHSINATRLAALGL